MKDTLLELMNRDLTDNGIENDQEVQTHKRGTEVSGYVNDR